MASRVNESDGSSSSRTRLEILDGAVRRLEKAGRSAPRRTAEWLLSELLDCDRAALYSGANRFVSSETAARFEEMLGRRVEGEPLQHILGYASFYGLRFDVSTAVMVPRPETELVVERALSCVENVEQPRVLDVGTGSGCIALTIKHQRPDAVVHGCDVSPEALAVARGNGDRLGLDVEFVEADLTAQSIRDPVPRNLDLLVSNPPYIPDAEADSLPDTVRNYDPDVALFAGGDPLQIYRALARWVRTLCVPGGSFVLEVHAEYGQEVRAELRDEGLHGVTLETDLSDRPRIVWGQAAGTER